MEKPIVGLTIRGIGFRDTAPTYVVLSCVSNASTIALVAQWSIIE
jgi:hypothetical protein